MHCGEVFLEAGDGRNFATAGCLSLYTTLGVAFSGGMFVCFREVVVVGGFRTEAVDSNPDPSPYEKIKTKRKKEKRKAEKCHWKITVTLLQP